MRHILQIVFAVLASSATVFLTLAGAVAGPLEEGALAYDNCDYRTALLHLRPLAETGDAEAATIVGWILMDGQMCGGEVPNDFGTALPLLFMAANKGYSPAQHALGDIYNHGGRHEPGSPWHIPLTEPNPTVAATWYQKAADQGHPFALRDLASLYESGRGVPQDLEEAIRLYRLAEEAGDFRAPDDLQRLGEK